jgi:hypothetical protein
VSETRQAERQAGAGAWIGFLCMAFAVVGLTGLFATYAAPLPRERELAREVALDDALARGPDPAALEALRDRLDDSAAAVLTGDAPLAERVQAERLAMRARFDAEAAATDTRLRWLVCVVTLMAASFGAAIIGGMARR